MILANRAARFEVQSAEVFNYSKRAMACRQRTSESFSRALIYPRLNMQRSTNVKAANPTRTSRVERSHLAYGGPAAEPLSRLELSETCPDRVLTLSRPSSAANSACSRRGPRSTSCVRTQAFLRAHETSTYRSRGLPLLVMRA